MNKLYKLYHEDKARLVVESVYWIAPVGKGGRYLTSGRSIYEQNAASAGYYYGTVKEIAKYLEEKVDLLGNKYGGDYTGSLTIHSLQRCLLHTKMNSVIILYRSLLQVTMTVQRVSILFM